MSVTALKVLLNTSKPTVMITVSSIFDVGGSIDETKGMEI